MTKGAVFCFTGLSGSGKSTLCGTLAAELLRSQVKVHMLDGDELRRTLCCDLSFSLEDRKENIKRIAYVAGTLAECGVTTLVAAITPLNEMRREARRSLVSYYEIFVSAPLEVCEQRDVKGLYKKARS